MQDFVLRTLYIFIAMLIVIVVVYYISEDYLFGPLIELKDLISSNSPTGELSPSNIKQVGIIFGIALVVSLVVSSVIFILGAIKNSLKKDNNS